MNGGTHLAVGLIAATLAGANRPEHFVVAAVGSLIADIDGGGSISRPVSQFLPHIVPRIAPLEIVDDVTEAGGSLIRRVFGHRGFLHWPLLTGAVLVLGILSNHTWLIWLVLGWICHIYADALTKQGIPLLAPFDLSKFRLLPKWLAIKTGGIIEYMIMGGLWFYLVIMVIRHLLHLWGKT